MDKIIEEIVAYRSEQQFLFHLECKGYRIVGEIEPDKYLLRKLAPPGESKRSLTYEWVKERVRSLQWELRNAVYDDIPLTNALKEAIGRGEENKEAAEIAAFNRGLREGNKQAIEQQKVIMALNAKLARLENYLR